MIIMFNLLYILCTIIHGPYFLMGLRVKKRGNTKFTYNTIISTYLPDPCNNAIKYMLTYHLGFCSKPYSQ